MKAPIFVSFLALTLLAGMVAAFAGIGAQSSAIAQDSVLSTAEHPIVGAWMLRVDVSDPNLPPHLVVYHGDGTYTDEGVGRAGGVGVWEPIDDKSVRTNVLFHTEDDDGNVGLTRIRTVTTVDDSGNAYNTEYTREVIAADGSSTGELGPGTGTAERITVEERGEPAGSEATPAA